MEIQLASILLDNKIVSDEAKTKACIITDMVKLGKLVGTKPPNWEEFCELYELSVPELELMQSIVENEYRNRDRGIQVDWRNIGKE